MFYWLACSIAPACFLLCYSTNTECATNIPKTIHHPIYDAVQFANELRFVILETKCVQRGSWLCTRSFMRTLVMTHRRSNRCLSPWLHSLGHREES